MSSFALLCLLALGVTQDSVQVSPAGTCHLRVVPQGGDFHHLEFALHVTARDGRQSWIPRVRGNGFLVSDLERIVVIDACESNAVPTALSLLDFEGRVLMERRVAHLTDPVLSIDGSHLAFRGEGGIAVLDLATQRETRHPNLASFAVGEGGLLAGTRVGGEGGVVLRATDGGERTTFLERTPRQVTFARDGSALFLLTADALWRWELSSDRLRLQHRAPSNVEWTGLSVTPEGVVLRARRTTSNGATRERFLLSPTGQVLNTGRGPVFPPPLPAGLPLPLGSIPWPLAPAAQHPVGNAYAQFQNYGGSPYAHPGVDVLGPDNEPVYSVSDGVVKAVLTTSGDWHWRVAVGDSGGAATTEGYLYAHLHPSTIAVNVGDVVTEGQYLGDLVPWPVSGFTHCHFARIEDSGNQWFGDWLCTDNPHVHFAPQTESQAPVFEPARGADLFAFCRNQTSNYLNPWALNGEVDIVAHVSDLTASTWEATVQEIRYTIHPVGAPGSPVVDDRLAVYFDMSLDTYQGGPFDPFLIDLLYKQDSTCWTEGDYYNREYYHIITNSDGDQVYESSDAWESWDTTANPNGDYLVKVTASDTAGNSTTESMVVTVSN